MPRCELWSQCLGQGPSSTGCIPFLLAVSALRWTLLTSLSPLTEPYWTQLSRRPGTPSEPQTQCHLGLWTRADMPLCSHPSQNILGGAGGACASRPDTLTVLPLCALCVTHVCHLALPSQLPCLPCPLPLGLLEASQASLTSDPHLCCSSPVWWPWPWCVHVCIYVFVTPWGLLCVLLPCSNTDGRRSHWALGHRSLWGLLSEAGSEADILNCAPQQGLHPKAAGWLSLSGVTRNNIPWDTCCHLPEQNSLSICQSQYHTCQ